MATAHADLHRRPAARPTRGTLVFDGPINGECFRAYVEQILALALMPGDIVVMDNLGSHKSAAVRQAIRAAGAQLTVWRFPPERLNPIGGLSHFMRLLAASALATAAQS